MPSRTPNLASLHRPWIAVLAGGIIGSAARTGLRYLAPESPGQFPLATLIVNLVGSMLIGYHLARVEQASTRPLSIYFWGVGVFGSLTTFSAFSIEVVDLLGRGQAATAIGYISTSIIGGVVLALAGLRFGSVIR